MRRELPLILILLALLSSPLYAGVGSVEVKAPNGLHVHNLNTGLNYTTIQEAINANETLDGHTIFVEEGIYYEHLLVNKSLTLQGENKENAVIDGSSKENVVNVTANYVRITSFKIQNSGSPRDVFHPPNAGIYVSSNSSDISNNTIESNHFGIMFSNSSNTTISENRLAGNQVGITCLQSSNITISTNYIGANAYHGIELEYSSNATIFGNNITRHPSGSGVMFLYSSNISILSNNITDNDEGLGFSQSSSCTIKSNSIRSNDEGISLVLSSNSTIAANDIVDNDKGISLHYSEANSFSGNNITENHLGINLEYYSTDNTILENNLTTDAFGIYVDHSSGNRIARNTMTNNTYGFCVDGYALGDFMNNIDSSNTIDGKPVYYLINQENLVINPSTFPSVGYIALVNSTNIRIEDVNLTRKYQGLVLAYTTNSTVSKNNMNNNYYGLTLYSCSNVTLSENLVLSNEYGLEFYSSSGNIISRNNITKNKSDGVRFSSSSCNNSVSENDIKENQADGIAFSEYSDNNTLTRNDIEKNTGGVALFSCSNNAISENDIVSNIIYGTSIEHSSSNLYYHNSFINNTSQASIGTFGFANHWDDGFEGNYWSNYAGVDSNHDGIGDSPFTIDASNADQHPLMGMFSGFDFTMVDKTYDVSVVSNSTVSSCIINSYGTIVYPSVVGSDGNNGTSVSFKVEGPNGTVGFCRTMIPAPLLNGSFTVYVDGINTTYTLLACSNNTHNYLYFSYLHSQHEIVIVPEFPSFRILTLSVAATLFAVMVYRRKHTAT